MAEIIKLFQAEPQNQNPLDVLNLGDFIEATIVVMRKDGKIERYELNRTSFQIPATA